MGTLSKSHVFAFTVSHGAEIVCCLQDSMVLRLPGSSAPQRLPRRRGRAPGGAQTVRAGLHLMRRCWRRRWRPGCGAPALRVPRGRPCMTRLPLGACSLRSPLISVSCVAARRACLACSWIQLRTSRPEVELVKSCIAQSVFMPVTGKGSAVHQSCRRTEGNTAELASNGPPGTMVSKNPLCAPSIIHALKP